MSKNKNRLKQEGNIAVFKDLGIFSEDPKEDQQINNNLRNFLTSLGLKTPAIKRVKKKK